MLSDDGMKRCLTDLSWRNHFLRLFVPSPSVHTHYCRSRRRWPQCLTSFVSWWLMRSQYPTFELLFSPWRPADHLRQQLNCRHATCLLALRASVSSPRWNPDRYFSWSNALLFVPTRWYQRKKIKRHQSRRQTDKFPFLFAFCRKRRVSITLTWLIHASYALTFFQLASDVHQWEDRWSLLLLLSIILFIYNTNVTRRNYYGHSSAFEIHFMAC